MEVNIPPGLARALGQDPGVTDADEERETAAGVKPEHEHEGEDLAVMEEAEGEVLDLKKVAADYAQYLAVNSRQDVSTIFSCRCLVSWLIITGWFVTRFDIVHLCVAVGVAS